MYSAIVAWLQSGPLPWLSMLVPRPGMLYAVVLLVCGAIFVRRATRVGISSERALEALLAIAVGALVGTRIFYLATRTRFWELSWSQLVDGRTGTASWGVYLGGIIALILYARWRKYSVLTLTDAATSAAALGCAIGRWNCLIAGDDYGRLTSWAWGIRYPARSMPWIAQLRLGLIDKDAAWSLPVHPNQIVQSAVSFAVFVIVSLYWYRHRDQRGRTTALFLMLYGTGRFFVEFLRNPSAGGAEGILSHSQYMCMAFVAGGAALWWWLSRKAATAPTPAAA